MRYGWVHYIEGNLDNPVNRGVLCAKGSAGIMQHNLPARAKASAFVSQGNWRHRSGERKRGVRGSGEVPGAWRCTLHHRALPASAKTAKEAERH